MRQENGKERKMANICNLTDPVTFQPSYVYQHFKFKSLKEPFPHFQR